MLAPRQRLGVLGVLVDAEGRVLVANHALRAGKPWGLPGGFVERGEHPATALARELREELGLDVEVGTLLRCDRDGVEPDDDGPSGLTLTYACRLAAAPPGGETVAATSWELFEARWLPLPEAEARVRGFEAEAARVAAALPNGGLPSGR